MPYSKIKYGLQLVRNMGMRYTLYRVRHEVEKKSGRLRKRHPIQPTSIKGVPLDEWRKSLTGDVFKAMPGDHIRPVDESLRSAAERIKNGEILFFSRTWLKLGTDYNWITNPSTGYQYEQNKHWSDIADLDPRAGDIKYVWEKSRFSYLLSIMRFDYHSGEDNSAFVFSDIESWIEANPINCGPNWRCSQEISLRIFNWWQILKFYQNSNHLTEALWDKIQQVVYWSLHHVYQHIDFSRIAVRNNHAITETLLLALSRYMFPFLPGTGQFASAGRKWFEEEISYQIYPDGTFLQFSMNYHRVVVQLLSFGIAVSENANERFSDDVYRKAHLSLNFLYQCCQEENGWLPNYGSNDGALFFPLSDSDFRDYRPQLNSLHFILTGEHLYVSDKIREDSIWYNSQGRGTLPTLNKIFGPVSFINGGYYLLRETDTFTFIRCGSHNDRPAQADNLHVDIWYRGENILLDSGSYKYNTEESLSEYFMGSAGHNTVMAGKHSQMLKGGRFIWYYWTQCLKAGIEETDDEYVFSGSISAFRFLNKNAMHHRTLKKKKGALEWIISDRLDNMDVRINHQLWHPNHSAVKIEAVENSKAIKQTMLPGYISNYYGEKAASNVTAFEFVKEITTTISIPREQ